MNKIQGELSIRLIKLYVIALGAVGIFSLIGQILIQVSISDQQNDARVINLAGRQRMLSQRLCKTAILLAHQDIFLADAEHYSQDINEIIILWAKVHEGLKNGLLELDKPIKVKNSATLDSMFKILDPVFGVMRLNAQSIANEIENPSLNKKAIVNHALALMLQNERMFLKTMDKIVFQYDYESKQRVERLKRIELLLFGITLIILFLEAIFIFRPTYINIKETIGTLTTSEANLQTLNHQLSEANTSLMKTKEELVNATEEKFRLQMKEEKVRTASVIEGQEEERKRIALELHDGIGQMLTGLKLTVEKLNKNVFDLDKDRKTFDELKELLNETIAETRVISFNLMPSVLNDFGIVSAIRLLKEQTEKNSNVDINITTALETERLPKNLEISLYRIVQEAINNALKHASATEILINLTESAKIIKLNIADNGFGFDMRKLKTKVIRNGIRNMQARTEMHNGEFKLSSGKGKGTHIFIKIPIL